MKGIEDLPGMWEKDGTESKSKHVLVITRVEDTEIDYEVEHPPECNAADFALGPHVRYTIYTCEVGRQLQECGIEAFDEFPDSVGRYEIEDWADNYSDPSFGEGNECGIKVLRSL